MLALEAIPQSAARDWDLRFLAVLLRLSVEWWSSTANSERARLLHFGYRSTLTIYRLRLSNPLILSRIFGCSSVMLAASAKTFAKAITLGYRAAGDRERARMTTASSSSAKSNPPSPASFSGIGGMVRS